MKHGVTGEDAKYVGENVGKDPNQVYQIRRYPHYQHREILGLL